MDDYHQSHPLADEEHVVLTSVNCFDWRFFAIVGKNTKIIAEKQLLAKFIADRFGNRFEENVSFSAPAWWDLTKIIGTDRIFPLTPGEQREFIVLVKNIIDRKVKVRSNATYLLYSAKFFGVRDRVAG